MGLEEAVVKYLYTCIPILKHVQKSHFGLFLFFRIYLYDS